MEGLVKSAESDKKTRLSWSQTKRKGENSETINVEKLDNEGYLVCICKSGPDKDKNWKSTESKLYSETNPLDPDDDDDNDGMSKLSSMLTRDDK
jgi:hypothetical protein